MKYSALVETSERLVGQRGNGGKVRIQIGSATCEDAAGSREVLAEFRKYIAASGRSDISIHETGCTGRCSREPIVGVWVPGQPVVKYEKVNRDLVHRIFTSHIQGGQIVSESVLDHSAEVHRELEFLFCSGSHCGTKNADRFRSALEAQLLDAKIDSGRYRISTANCIGACADEEVGRYSYLLVRPQKILYRIESEEDLAEIVSEQVIAGKPVERLRVAGEPRQQRFLDLYGDVAFFSRQSRIALRNCGIVNPESIEEYVQLGGFSALTKVLEKNDPFWTIGEVMSSNLRGRGGAGFPTGKKWEMVAKLPSDQPVRYIICNADEGDPGAFMDRSMLESDPFSVIEGMMIGGHSIGAQKGFFYIRAEYPLAIKRIETAIDQCRQNGVLGSRVLDTDFSFDLEIRLGAGAFVCGEETALIHSIEGERGQPRIRPPYPAESGLWGQPTVINNVETFANVPAILTYGSQWFRRIGTEKSGGTKVFALAGKVNHTGLVEVPMGTSLREVVFDIGGGVPGGKQIKGIQTGGPAGGCIPAKWLDLAVDYDTLSKAGSIMGSGGMIILDEDDCMVDIAKFFMTFSQEESCGKCTPCREGTKRILEILERITSGNGAMEDIDKLKRLGNLIRKSSLCGLGRAAPNPVLSTLEHFQEEYLAHITDRKCPARKCTALIHYEIIPEKCVGCTLCARNCPVTCISGVRREAHLIDQARCIKCGRCFEVCRFSAVNKS